MSPSHSGFRCAVTTPQRFCCILKTVRALLLLHPETLSMFLGKHASAVGDVMGNTVLRKEKKKRVGYDLLQLSFFPLHLVVKYCFRCSFLLTQ